MPRRIKKIGKNKKMIWKVFLSTFKYNKTRYKLNVPLQLEVEYDNLYYCIISNELNQFTCSEHIDEAINDMEYLIGILYKEYGLEKDNNLSYGAINYKKKMKRLCEPLKRYKGD